MTVPSMWPGGHHTVGTGTRTWLFAGRYLTEEARFCLCESRATPWSRRLPENRCSRVSPGPGTGGVGVLCSLSLLVGNGFCCGQSHLPPRQGGAILIALPGCSMGLCVSRMRRLTGKDAHPSRILSIPQAFIKYCLRKSLRQEL